MSRLDENLLQTAWSSQDNPEQNGEEALREGDSLPVQGEGGIHPNEGDVQLYGGCERVPHKEKVIKRVDDFNSSEERRYFMGLAEEITKEARHHMENGRWNNFMKLRPVNWMGYHEISVTPIQAVHRGTEYLAIKIRNMCLEGVPKNEN